MGIFLIALPFAALIASFIIVLILFKSEKELSDKIFIFLNVAILLWILADIFYSETNERIFFWAIVTYVIALFLPYLYLIFTRLFLTQKKISKYEIPLLSVVPTILIILIVSRPNLMIENSKIPFVFGPLYYIYTAYLIIYFVAGYMVLISKIRFFKNIRIRKRQIQFIFYGSLLSSVLAFVSALLLPIFKTYTVYFFSPVFILIMSIFVAYAIFRHSLFNIKVIATEVFSSLIAIIFFIDALLSEGLSEGILKFALFIGVVIFSILLIKSVLSEIRSKEKLAQITKSLKKANIELKKLDKAKSEFISIASHQLRTPLSIIKGYLSMILEGFYGKTSNKIEDKLEKTLKSNERLIKLVDHLLDLSHMEGGRMKFEFEHISVSEIVKEAVEEYDPSANKKGLELIYHEPKKDSLIVNADEEKLRQVIINLIDNGIKYTREGRVDIYLRRTDGHLIFSVKDTGIGVSKEEKSHLFEKFIRGKKVSRIWTEGIGLGLYVARLIVEAHRGEIGVESKGEGKGSEFWVKLPLAER